VTSDISVVEFFFLQRKSQSEVRTSIPFHHRRYRICRKGIEFGFLKGNYLLLLLLFLWLNSFFFSGSHKVKSGLQYLSTTEETEYSEEELSLCFKQEVFSATSVVSVVELFFLQRKSQSEVRAPIPFHHRRYRICIKGIEFGF